MPSWILIRCVRSVFSLLLTMPDRSPRSSGKSGRHGRATHPTQPPLTDPRQLAFVTLGEITKKDAYADVALDRHLAKSQLASRDRALATELVYGCVRQRRTLDAIIDRLAKKTAQQQPPDLRVVLHLGLYQLVYSDRIPTSAAVDTTVDLAKRNGLAGLSGFVNGLLRQYLRTYGEGIPSFEDITEPIEQLAVRTSFPNWIVSDWVEQLGWDEAEQLCHWFDRAPQMHLRVNRQVTSREEILAQFAASDIDAEPMTSLPDGIRLVSGAGRWCRGRVVLFNCRATATASGAFRMVAPSSSPIYSIRNRERRSLMPARLQAVRPPMRRN
ncbi:MAG: hypothetical protein EAZ61_04380 [Oscillatoriales cyanobacterium]|nr:MAG: hypothetical protein EAZ61_04380 [Oscillatoriales cyanobacterium]